MKVLMLNGSGRAAGNTFQALTEIGKQLETEGIRYEIVQLGTEPIRDCVSCGYCGKNGACVYTDDMVNEFVAKAKEADAFVFGTPVYYAHPSGRILSFLDRVFYSAPADVFAFKPGAALAVARRGGTTASFDVLNKYFGISQMPVVSSTYWNIAHGRKVDEVQQDAEGLQTLRNVGRNMAWMLKCFEAGKKAGVPMPETERGAFSNFIH